MSYILDALKRAEAERVERRPKALSEAVGGASQPPNRRPKTAWSKRWAWGLLAAVVLLAVAATLGWQQWGKPTSDGLPVEAPTAPETNPEKPPETSAAPAPSERLAEPPPEPIPGPVLPILAKAPPVPPPPPPPAGGRPGSGENSAAKSPPPQNTAQARPSPAESSATNALPALSAAARAALPAVQVSGSSYSANREHRMLIANGQVVKEGQELSPGFTLEVIGPHSAVFNHNGTRFNINY